VAAANEFVDCMGADKTSSACNQVAHVRRLLL
jgi:hypothetical protein